VGVKVGVDIGQCGISDHGCCVSIELEGSAEGVARARTNLPGSPLGGTSAVKKKRSDKKTTTTTKMVTTTESLLARRAPPSSRARVPRLIANTASTMRTSFGTQLAIISSKISHKTLGIAIPAVHI
jgi:hypothetical protein